MSITPSNKRDFIPKPIINKSNSFEYECKHSEYNARSSLINHGITIESRITSTLQGSIYRGTYNEAKTGIKYDVVIKRASISLSKHGIGKIGDNQYTHVYEDIKKEVNLMAFISNNNNKPPKGILKMHKFIDDGHNYFIIMDYGGKSFFNHVISCHKLIKNGVLSTKEWSKHVKIIFKQMCIILDYLHNKVHCCHLDISLENFLIKDFELKNGKIISHGQIYICDWGLGEYFGKNSQFKCDKYAGKIQYESPEIISKLIYDARKADIWSLGICLFMIQFGVSPLSIANNTDPYFKNIINGHLNKMIIQNNKCKYIDNKDIINLLNNVLCLQNSRVYINAILKHTYLQ